MKGVHWAAAATAVFASTALADVDPIVIKGSHFFYKSNGTEFFIKGVAYQQDYSTNTTGAIGSSGNNTYIDPLADTASCRRDIPQLIALGTNTIRTYAIDPTQNHDDCMQMLQDAGIYVISDLSQPGLSINRDEPTWDIGLYNRYTSVVDSLSKYNNVIGFFAGNEVSNNASNTDAMAFVKAAARDMKSYIKSKNYRPLGVGYAANDDTAILNNLADYTNCGPSEGSIDFFGYNIYSWCGQSNYVQSHYQEHTEMFANYSVPTFFAEYGCNVVQPRLFDEVQALYGTNMTPVWSGGIVYMYFQEQNDYGLVSVSGNSVSELPDYTSLSSQIAKATPSSTAASDYTPSNTVAQACPATGVSWNASETLPPTPNQAICSCMTASLGCIAKPGLSADAEASLFGQVCGLNRGAACAGIARNGASGTYGAYSMCDTADQLNFVLNQYYTNQQSSSSACDWKGQAQVVSAASASGSCSSLLNQAGPSGTGTVSSSGGASSGTKKAGAGLTTVPKFDFGLLQLGVYVVGAMVTGAGMILL